MRAVVDTQKCIGSGMCTSIAPTVFALDDDGVLVLLHGEELTAAEEELARDAAECCPAEAIDVVD
jgi:ferredoxin